MVRTWWSPKMLGLNFPPRNPHLPFSPSQQLTATQRTSGSSATTEASISAACGSRWYSYSNKGEGCLIYVWLRGVMIFKKRLWFIWYYDILFFEDLWVICCKLKNLIVLGHFGSGVSLPRFSPSLMHMCGSGAATAHKNSKERWELPSLQGLKSDVYSKKYKPPKKGTHSKHINYIRFPTKTNS